MKVFTITEGLENLGAMKTGGQGSVYKGRRIGEITTAIKLLPTPIHSESEDDKSYVDFKNEVEKLKKVNEDPNPNVVKILSSGVSDTGNFPFIEMEFIEGPDLEDLLKPPHAAVFTIKEALKVADQLSHALAHCHKVEVRHGDIKSNNVKYNIHTGNYVLLDFGLAVMSDEQRRSSLRHAGAIEFMAPEQNEGQMLYQTDVYGLGIILFELIAGQVPFPLHDKGETARNIVRLSHMETPPPDMLELRRAALPLTWSAEKREHEMHVPEWLVDMIYKCLEKKPEDRFATGIELHEYIVLNSTLAAKKEEASVELSDTFMEENKKLMREKDELQKLLQHYQRETNLKDKELEELKAIVVHKDSEVRMLKQNALGETIYTEPTQKGVSRTAFLVLLFICVGLAALAAYSLFGTDDYKEVTASNGISSDSTSTATADTGNTRGEGLQELKKNAAIKTSQTVSGGAAEINNAASTNNTDSAKQETRNNEGNNDNVAQEEKKEEEDTQDDTDKQKPTGQYKVRNVAYFHNKPDGSTRRNAFINHWNNAILNPLEEQNGFIYIVYTNDEGRVSKGWLQKKDLIRIKD